MSLKDYLAAAIIFVGAMKGISSLQLARQLGIQQSAAFLLLHKFREAIVISFDDLKLSGVVEIDGCTIGGYRRVENTIRNVFVKRRYVPHMRNRRVVTIMSSRMGGRTIPVVGRTEMDACPTICEKLEPGTVIVADGAHAWDGLAKLFDMLRLNHKYSFSANSICTNNAESFFAGLRRMCTGTHHRISGDNLQIYAMELAWKFDHRKLDQTARVLALLSLILQAPHSKRWRGYRSKKLPIHQDNGVKDEHGMCAIA